MDTNQNKTADYIIVIPAYKPSTDLLNVLRGVVNHFSKVIVVDDGSEPKFYNIFNEAETMGCTVLRHYTNLGKGRALKTAFNHCLSLQNENYRGIITVDADGQHKLEDIISICNTLEEKKNTLVLGARDFNQKDIPLRSRFGNKVTKNVFCWFCGIQINDTQTGLRGIPFQFLDLLCHIEGEKYEYETNMLLKCKEENINIYEVTIATVYENDNESSHFNPLSDSIKIYRTILSYSFSSLLATAIDFTLFSILINNGMRIIFATYIARICAMFVNFVINRRIVFRTRGDLKRQFIKYVMLVAVSGTCSGFLVKWATESLQIQPILCKVVVETILYIANYYIQHNFIFIKEGGHYDEER